jgi:hypothetical protein
LASAISAIELALASDEAELAPNAFAGHWADTEATPTVDVSDAASIYLIK